MYLDAGRPLQLRERQAKFLPREYRWEITNRVEAAQLARKVRKQIDGARESKAGEAIAVDLMRAR